MDRNTYFPWSNGKTKSVVPYVGTWIEMFFVLRNVILSTGRSLRGTVDRNGQAFDGNTITIGSFPTWERG